jgi:hypothetical protein
MRILEILLEDSLSYSGLRPKYLENMIQMIETNHPFVVVSKAKARYGDYVKLSPSAAEVLKAALNSPLDSKGYLEVGRIAPLELLEPTEQLKTILITHIEKTAAIKGGAKAYNLGYVGEIALGIATACKFLHAGKEVGPKEFVAFVNKMGLSDYVGKTGKIGNSKQLSGSGKIKHKSGKVDNFECVIKAPGNDVIWFKNAMKAPGEIPAEVQSTILSAIHYARTEEKIKAGIAQAAADPNTNKLQVISDGISDNKGTKADLIMDIDGNKINLLSVKTGESQLGQASGHEWTKQQDFFKIVFGVNATPFKAQWGTTVAEHLNSLKGIWGQLVIPKVSRLVGGDSNQKEAELVKSIANGLIRYSNNYDNETGETETVDIVKLAVDPGSPGYNLMKIDARLVEALAKVNLVGSSPPSGMGINIHGRIHFTDAKGNPKFKDTSLCRMWSTGSGKTVRTAVAGGPLLDELAFISKVMVEPNAPTSPPRVADMKKAMGVQPNTKIKSKATIPAANIDTNPNRSLDNPAVPNSINPNDHISQV